MKLKVTLAAVLVVAAATPAMAGEDKSQDQAQAVKEKKICRTENVTGSLISKRRICMTKAEWDELARNSKESIDKFASRQSGLPASAANPAAPQ